MKRIAIQGLVGSFHDMAAHQYFKNEQMQLICCATFEQVFDAIRLDPTVIGMLAIENTIAGSLLHNYELMRDSGTTVVGEHKLHISHCICCLPEDDWTSVQEVHSHPVALMQCRHFLANHPTLKLVEAEDTAGSAKHISENQCRGWAAICSSDAGYFYANTQEEIESTIRRLNANVSAMSRARNGLLYATLLYEEPVRVKVRLKVGGESHVVSAGCAN